MIEDWYHKVSLPIHLVEDLNREIFPMLEKVKWLDCDPSQAPGSVWCLLTLPEQVRKRLEAAAQYKIYPDFYIWNYRDVKILKIHKDTNAPGASRSVAGVIPLLGDFETQVYNDSDFHKPMATCQYGPGDLLFLNNTKYHHGGRVLSPTRISMHFYFDFYNTHNESLATLLKKNKLD